MVVSIGGFLGCTARQRTHATCAKAALGYQNLGPAKQIFNKVIRASTAIAPA